VPEGTKVYAFGSRAKWTAKEFSDLDICLKGPERLPSKVINAIAEELEDSDLPYKVDVIDWHAISPSFQNAIEKDLVEVDLAEWDIVPFGVVIDIISGGTPKTDNPEYWNGDIPWLSVADFNNGQRWVDTAEKAITTKGLRESATQLLQPTQVIISARGTVGMVAQIAKPMAFNQSCYGLTGKDGIYNDFLYYLTKTAVETLKHIGHGAVFNTITRETFNSVSVHVPPLDIQKEISFYLGCLDEKINLNRQMNETLEAMARAIFKDWFVDFGPTRAKMEGRAPYLAPDLWALFPDRLGDDGLPVGWENEELKNQFELTMGQSPPGESYNTNGNGVPFFQGRTDFGFRFPSNRVYCTAPSRFATQGDTLVSVRAPVGDVNIALTDCCIGRGIAAVRHNANLTSYTYYYMSYLREVFASFEQSGTVFGSINKEQFGKLEIINTKNILPKAFESLVSAFDITIKNNEVSTQSLAESRDMLLPKLMTGEVRVSGEKHYE
jgi:type I restriction enzyme S subunit